MNKILRFSDSEKVFQCPICKTDLKLKQKSLFCSNHHCFDISKTGYVNFAVGTKSSKHYSRETFQIRREVLEKGYYSHILNEVVQLIKSFSSIDTILDIGCGEGYYSKQIKEVSGDKEIIAFDISKDAVQLAAKSDFSNSIKWFVGNLEEMPIKDKRIDCILDIFTPANYSEFNRVLKEGGYVIKVIPGNAHLKELRETAKEQLKSNQYSNAAVVDYGVAMLPILEIVFAAMEGVRNLDRKENFRKNGNSTGIFWMPWMEKCRITRDCASMSVFSIRSIWHIQRCMNWMHVLPVLSGLVHWMQTTV